jgi:hypothetical protein
VVWKALAAALESGADGDFLQITADLFPGQFLPRFWEKVELILTECGLLQQGRLTESPGDNKVKLPERCSASCTYCETQNLRVTSEKFQQLMLQGSLEAIASALDNITIKGLKL